MAQKATLSAGQSRIGCKRSVDVARPAHLGAVVAARPRIRDVIRDATIAGLIAVQSLLARLDDLVETASAPFLDTLNDSGKRTAHSYLQQAVQAADEAWQDMVHDKNWPTQSLVRKIAGMEPINPSPQGDKDGEEVTNAPALSRLCDRTRL